MQISDDFCTKFDVKHLSRESGREICVRARRPAQIILLTLRSCPNRISKSIRRVKRPTEPITIEQIRAAHAERRAEIRDRIAEFKAVHQEKNDERIWEEMVFC